MFYPKTSAIIFSFITAGIFVNPTSRSVVLGYADIVMPGIEETVGFWIEDFQRTAMVTWVSDLTTDILVGVGLSEASDGPPQVAQTSPVERSPVVVQQDAPIRPAEAIPANTSVTQNTSQPRPTPVSQARTSGPQPYDITLYDHWVDLDQDCQNQRAELLISLSKVPVTLTSDGCHVVSGEWYDPYNDITLTNAAKIGINHLVPLEYAHQRGANIWSEDKRRHFANNPMNLFIVDVSSSRAKGSAGPLEWVPGNANFICTYVTRFDKVMRTYDLTYAPWEVIEIDRFREMACLD